MSFECSEYVTKIPAQALTLARMPEEGSEKDMQILVLVSEAADHVCVGMCFPRCIEAQVLTLCLDDSQY